jgi:hypothetical protein
MKFSHEVRSGSRIGVQWGIFAAAIAIAVCLAVGCGRTPNRGVRVSGTVTVGGNPAPGAIVRFFDENQGVGAGTAGDDGTYVAVDVPRKSLRVSVEETPTSGPYGWTPPPSGTPTLPGTLTVKPAKIPKKYQKPDTSGLTVTIDGKEQKFDLALE